MGLLPIHYAAHSGHPEQLEVLLDQPGVLVNATDADGWTPLMWACTNRRFPVERINLLIAKGADIWARGDGWDHQWSPLRLARFNGLDAEVQALLQPDSAAKGSEGVEPERVWDEEFHQIEEGNWLHGECFACMLGETTPQELVAELGPPNATYRKNDQRMTIHKIRTASHSRTRANGTDTTRPDELTDTDQSSAHTGSDDSNDEVVEDDAVGRVGGECFYNYFYLGFDVLVSTPTPPSQPPPTTATTTLPPSSTAISESPDRLVATKLVLHGNVPGSYEFNRHRRCRWEISYLGDDAAGTTTANSEARFTDIEEGLHEAWKGLLPSGDGRQRQRGMVLNRGWGDSPGSSVEFLGGWEDSGGHGGVQKLDGGDDSTTTLYGFPGLVFEVLKNGADCRKLPS
ncbi:hypothetical protein HYQ46_013405 [Verticillium longisporum]|nr:hypothetical protein HYQ46_013405 [Verticillium longisporum]